MRIVLVEANRIWDFDRHWPNFDFDPRGAKHRHSLPIELGHRAGHKWECLAYSIRRLEHKFVLQEVKPELKCSVSIRDPRRRQTPSGNVQRDVPPVVHERRQAQSDLAHDLRPHMERGVGVFP